MEYTNIGEMLIGEGLKKHIKHSKKLLRKPFEQLLNLRKRKSAFYVSQAPYIGSDGKQRWTDFSVKDENVGLDIRVEVKSLNVNTALKNAVYDHIMESIHIPESRLIIVLLGKGFDELLKLNIQRLINTNNFKVTIMYGVQEFYDYIDSFYKK